MGPLLVLSALSAVALPNPWNQPPEPIERCQELLAERSVRFRAAAEPVRRTRGGLRCGVEQGVRYLGGPGRIAYNRTPRLSCGMALALARFEAVVQEEARRRLGRAVSRIVHAGTYACREMAAYPGWVSEHAWANAIDIASFEIAGGRVIAVSNYHKPGATGDFLRAVARRLVDENVFTVVLTPAFDRRHANHFHLDLARYHVDGT
jgi:hypothetical protein